MEYLGPTVQYDFGCAPSFDEQYLRMLKIVSCVVLYCTMASSQTSPYVAPLPVPIVPPVSPILPVNPYAPTPRPIGLPGYNNPYYNQYNRVPGVPVAPGAVVPILTYSSEHVGDGTYAFSFTTADGKQAQESSYLKDAFIDNNGEPQGTQVVQGSYAYISPEGTPIQVSYIADENGFRPSGVHIPADGKAAIPLIADKDRQILDPLLNRYDPFTARNRYNLNGKYNNLPYDPRYPYETAKYNSLYNSARPYDPKYPYEVAKYNPLYNNPLIPPIIGQGKTEVKKSA